MSVRWIGTPQAPPGTTESLRDFLPSIIPLIKSSQEWESVTFYQSHDDPARFTMIEAWGSIESHQSSVKNITPEKLTVIKPFLVSAPGRGSLELITQEKLSVHTRSRLQEAGET
jgi:quinol monooxygenase YgiN